MILFYCARAIFLMLLHACTHICWQIFFIYIGFFFLSNLGDCWKCAQHDYGWSMLGDLIDFEYQNKTTSERSMHKD
jgi:hypothetical protein